MKKTILSSKNFKPRHSLSFFHFWKLQKAKCLFFSLHRQMLLPLLSLSLTALPVKTLPNIAVFGLKKEKKNLYIGKNKMKNKMRKVLKIKIEKIKRKNPWGSHKRRREMGDWRREVVKFRDRGERCGNVTTQSGRWSVSLSVAQWGREIAEGGEASGVGETKRHGLFAIFRKWKKEREWMGFEIFGG